MHRRIRSLKGKEDYLYSAILVRHIHKALRHRSHRFTCKLHHAWLSFVSVHHMTPPLTEVADIQLQLTTHFQPRRDERLTWPGWLTYSGWFTHISGHPATIYRSSAGQGSSPAKNRLSTAVPATHQTNLFGICPGTRSAEFTAARVRCKCTHWTIKNVTFYFWL